jgi:hypothetical protein
MNYTKVDEVDKEQQKGVVSMQIKRPILKKIALELCTCTWIEILTGAGITLISGFGGSHNDIGFFISSINSE